jgi:hypothetical protein
MRSRFGVGVHIGAAFDHGRQLPGKAQVEKSAASWLPAELHRRGKAPEAALQLACRLPVPAYS